MPQKDIIKLSNVWKTYQMGTVEVHALRGLSLEIKQGEFLAIQGPSGSGKSTMMNLVGALDLASKGDIFLDSFKIDFGVIDPHERVDCLIGLDFLKTAGLVLDLEELVVYKKRP